MKNEEGRRAGGLEGRKGEVGGGTDERVKNKNRMGFNEGNGHSCRTMTQKTDGAQ